MKIWRKRCRTRIQKPLKRFSSFLDLVTPSGRCRGSSAWESARPGYFSKLGAKLKTESSQVQTLPSAHEFSFRPLIDYFGFFLWLLALFWLNSIVDTRPLRPYPAAFHSLFRVAFLVQALIWVFHKLGKVAFIFWVCSGTYSAYSAGCYLQVFFFLSHLFS